MSIYMNIIITCVKLGIQGDKHAVGDTGEYSYALMATSAQLTNDSWLQSTEFVPSPQRPGLLPV